MPITPFLNGERFDSETRRVLGLALEMTCLALRTGDCDDVVRRAIAPKIVALAKAGERNPDVLCEQALREIRSGAEQAALVGPLPVSLPPPALGDCGHRSLAHRIEL
jgi:hypothetical protein